MKSPAAGMKVRSVPATIPGAESGSVTRRNVCVGARVQVLRRLEQPRVDLLERHVERQRHEGEEVVGDPRDHGEGRVASRPPSAPSTWTSRRSRSPAPWSDRMLSHASVRTRYVTKNGATMKSRQRFRQGPRPERDPVDQRIRE